MIVASCTNIGTMNEIQGALSSCATGSAAGAGIQAQFRDIAKKLKSMYADAVSKFDESMKAGATEKPELTSQMNAAPTTTLQSLKSEVSQNKTEAPLTGKAGVFGPHKRTLADIARNPAFNTASPSNQEAEKKMQLGGSLFSIKGDQAAANSGPKTALKL